MMNNNDVTELAEKAKQGSKTAFEKLYKEFYQKLYYFVKQNVSAPDAAEDITAETFCSAMEHISELHSNESFVGWLYCIAYHKCADYNKKTATDRRCIDGAAELAALSEPVFLPDDYAVNTQTKQQLQAVIDSLPPDMRAVIILYYYDDLSLAEVAKVIGTNKNNAAQKLHTARKKLRSKIEKLIGKGSLFSAVPLSAVLANLENAGLLSGAAATAAAFGAAAAVPVTLSKLSGGTAKELTRFTFKYWRRHKKSLAALLFSGVLLCAVVCCAFLQVRGEANRQRHALYDIYGQYDVMLINADDSFLNDLTVRKQPEKAEQINVLGDVDVYGNKFAYGYADGSIDLAHIPFKSGNLPEKENEAAVSIGVLKQAGYNGTVGDTICIGGKEYTLKGIINEEYDNRIASQINIDALQNGVVSPTPIPLIYIGKPSDAPKTLYTITMYSGVVKGEDENTTVFGMPINDFTELVSEEFGAENSMWSLQINNNDPDAAKITESKGTSEDTRWLIILLSIAAVIAVLSLFSVLRIIFAQRRNTFEILRRIGVSKRKTYVLYTTECLLFTIVQTIVGFGAGILFYTVLHRFQVNALEYTDYSAFTSDRIITNSTYDPFVVAALFSAAVMILSYLICIILSGLRENRRVFGLQKKTARSMINTSLSCKIITVIQTVSLTLIVIGSLLGYIYYSSDGKDFMNYLTYEPPASFEIAGELDMQQDGIEEYYCCQKTNSIIVGDETNGLPLMQPDYSSGLDDDTVNKLGDVTATGELTGTFLYSDEENGKLGPNIIVDDKLKSISEVSNKNYKNFFNSGNIGSKHLYSATTKLVNEQVLKTLESSVISGKIDIDALNSGKEVIALVSFDTNRFKVQEELNIAAAEFNESYGIKSVSSAKIKIGAVVKVSGDTTNRLLAHVLSGNRDYYLVTTQQGAQTMGLYGAKYTELFSNHHIDGGLIPPSSNMEKMSLSELKHKRFLEKASSLGSVILLIVFMAILGFAAYFNGIGLKIMLKEYDISIMRAVGTSRSRIRRQLFISNLRIPLFSTLLASTAVIALQKHLHTMYDKVVSIAAPNEAGVIEFTEDINQKQHTLIDKYFLNSEMWLVNITKPLLVVFTVVAVITVTLTFLNMRRFNDDIASSISKGRKRR